MGRHSLVGGKHELLYDLMCPVPLRHDDVLGLTLYVQYYLGLRKVKIYAPPLRPLFLKPQTKLLHDLEIFVDLLVSGYKLLILIYQHLPYYRICQPLNAVDYGVIEGAVNHPPIFIYYHLSGHGKPVDLWVQGTDAVAEFLRQHRDSPVREICAGASDIRLPVQRAPFLYIVGYVGNGDPEPYVPVLLLFYSYCIVKVLGPFSINGYGVHPPEIDPVLYLLLVNYLRNFPRLNKDILREFIRNAVFPHYGHHLYIRVIREAHYLRNLPVRAPVGSRIVDYLGHHYLAVLCIPCLPLRDKDVPQYLLLRWYHISVILLSLKPPDNRCQASLQYPYNLTLFLSVFLDTLHPHQYLIAVHHLSEVPRRNVYVTLSFDRDHKGVPVPVT